MSDFLTIKQIRKTFNEGKESAVTALKEINLTFKKGEFSVISGPSGSGKTTLLNLIGGLDTPSSGDILLDGREINFLNEEELSKQRRNCIGFVFQAYNLIPVLDVKDNISYIMKLQKKEDSLIQERLEWAVQRLGIADLLDKYPSELSGGQQQRVAVARAIVAKPKLILADEPTANLDGKNAEALISVMEKLNEEERITVIFSSHDPRVISKAKRSIVLEDGEVIKDEVIS